MKNLIFTILILLIFVSCHNYDNKLLIVNNSTEFVWVHTFYHRDIKLEDVVNPNHNIFYISESPILKPKTSTRPLTRGFWEYNIKENSKDSTLTVAYFNKDTLSKYGWPKIISDKIYTFETYSLKELNEKKWIIKYKN